MINSCIWLAQVPLKRIARAYRESNIELYALKLIKSQVPYLGLKWRTGHMKTVSAISRRCRFDLRDDWLIPKEEDEAQIEREQASYTVHYIVYILFLSAFL